MTIFECNSPARDGPWDMWVFKTRTPKMDRVGYLLALTNIVTIEKILNQIYLNLWPKGNVEKLKIDASSRWRRRRSRSDSAEPLSENQSKRGRGGVAVLLV